MGTAFKYLILYVLLCVGVSAFGEIRKGGPVDVCDNGAEADTRVECNIESCRHSDSDLHAVSDLHADSDFHDAEDSISGKYRGKNLYYKVKDWLEHIDDPRPDKNFRFDFVGAPYYAEDVKFAIGLLGTALYKVKPVRPECPLSYSNIKLQLSTTLYYSATVYGTNYDAGDKLRIKYFLKFQSFPTYFWGTGFDAGFRKGHSDFRELSLKLKTDFLFRAAENLYFGPGVDFKWFLATKKKNRPDIWEGYDSRSLSPGVGIITEYDSRDMVTEPQRGVYFRLSQMFYPHFLGNGKKRFGSTEINFGGYRRICRGGVLAGQVHFAFTYGNTPWGMMPTFGDGSMRGYYVGRFRDKCEYDLTLEYRQHIWKRSGMVVWAGAGSVAPDIREFRLRTILPNFGIGYRFRFRKGSNIRVDFGVGRGTYGFEFNINECF